MMFKREIRNRFDLLKYDLTQDIQNKRIAQADSYQGTRAVNFSEGDNVWVDDYSVDNENRIEAKIVKKLSPVTFEVETLSGQRWKRHSNQMLKTESDATLKHNNQDARLSTVYPERRFSQRIANKQISS